MCSVRIPVLSASHALSEEVSLHQTIWPPASALLMSRPSTNASRPGSTSSRNSLQSTGTIHLCIAACIVLIVFPGKLSDSTSKLLEDMAKKSGLALKQINEVRGIAALAFSFTINTFHFVCKPRTLTAFIVKASFVFRLLAAFQATDSAVSAHGERSQPLKRVSPCNKCTVADSGRASARSTALTRCASVVTASHACAVPLNPLNYAGSRRTDIQQEQRPV